MPLPATALNGARVLLVTGNPGIGKTTLTQQVVDELHESFPSLVVDGFYTQEQRSSSGQREGFELVSIGPDGGRAQLSHVSVTKGPRVGKYGVNIEAVDTFSKQLRQRLSSSPGQGSVSFLVLDEIGKMECFSTEFTELISVIRDASIPVLMTIAQRGKGLIQEVKTWPRTHIVELTKANSRDSREAQDGVLSWVREHATAASDVTEAS